LVCGGGQIVLEDARDVLILDGDCGLCHRLANFIDKRIIDRELLAFRPGNSKDAEILFSRMPESLRRADTVYLIRDGRTYIRSAAAIRCLLYMGLHWRVVFPVLWIVPLPIRDLSYRIVAKYRHLFFKRPEKCTFRID
jgi:predicted DCC family thiol-disulfide oxidoreductase YuxK